MIETSAPSSARWWAIAAIALLLGGYCVIGPWRTAVARGLGLAPEKQPFADAWVITAGAMALERGIDPLRSNPDDPWGRPMNYPRVVGWIAQALRLDNTDASRLGLCFDAAALLGICVLLGCLPRITVAVALATVSPALLFGLERGNLDLLVFGAVCVFTQTASARLLPAAVPFLCSLKIYPAAACVHAALPGERRRLAWLLAGVACAAYGVAIARDLPAIRASTPVHAPLSWGVRTLDLRLHRPSALVFSLGASVAAVAAGVAVGRKVGLPAAMSATTFSAAATGAAIFVFCHFLGTNFNYRRIWLLLLLPALATAGRNDRTRSAVRLASAIILLALWSPSLIAWAAASGVRGAWLLDETSIWLALAVCGAALGAVASHRPETVLP